jgi:hypothetical protein
MCIVYWTVHLVDQHVIIYVLLMISEFEKMWKEADATYSEVYYSYLFPEGLWLSCGPGTCKIQSMFSIRVQE